MNQVTGDGVRVLVLALALAAVVTGLFVLFAMVVTMSNRPAVTPSTAPTATITPR